MKKLSKGLVVLVIMGAFFVVGSGDTSANPVTVVNPTTNSISPGTILE